MQKYLSESLYWVNLAISKPITLVEKSVRLTGKEAVVVSLKVLPVILAISLVLLTAVGGLYASTNRQFNWPEALKDVAYSVPLFGLTVMIMGRLFGGMVFEHKGMQVGGLIGWLLGGLGGGLGIVLTYLTRIILFQDSRADLEQSFNFGLASGLILGLIFSFTGAVFELKGGLTIGLLIGLFIGIGGFIEGVPQAVCVWLGYASIFLVIFLRPFYLVPYAFQYWRSNKFRDPFKYFRNSPVYWDEAIALPLPYLKNWLTHLAAFDYTRGLTEILFVEAKRPYQRRVATTALVDFLLRFLEKVDSLEEMARIEELLHFLPYDLENLPVSDKFLLGGLTEARPRVNTISVLAQDFLTRKTQVGRLKMLEEMHYELDALRNVMTTATHPVNETFRRLALLWLEIVRRKEEECRQQLQFEPIPNPFVAGNPLKQHDHELFKGRRDIIVAIEENIINPSQRPALLLHGRRRIGKTSTLLNLPRQLSSQYVPVFIDCQGARWRDGDAAFCYHLASSVYGELFQRNLLDGLGKPALEQFEQYAFTRLDEFLDGVEALSRCINKQILLTFDEYERLGKGIEEKKITHEVFNQLRNIVQHRARIVVLFSGGHRFEELRGVNWSDYLINVKTLELSFLAPADARELLTEPVPALHYEAGVVDAIIGLTHCQPYLLQAVASDLVNYLNAQKRQMATQGDLDVAVAKVLVTADAYFHNNWAECSDAERGVLLALATGAADSVAAPQYQTAVQSLSRKEMVERDGAGWRLTIELFRRWLLKNQVAPG
jgi:uncharacterized protein